MNGAGFKRYGVNYKGRYTWMLATYRVVSELFLTCKKGGYQNKTKKRLHFASASSPEIRATTAYHAFLGDALRNVDDYNKLLFKKAAGTKSI